MNKLFSHMYYMQEVENRDSAFVRKLLAYYSPGSAAYEKLDGPQLDFLKVILLTITISPIILFASTI
jgi:hypothetical protein